MTARAIYRCDYCGWETASELCIHTVARPCRCGGVVYRVRVEDVDTDDGEPMADASVEAPRGMK